jgi:chloramphenicol 3-O phosphotransferase
MIFKNIIIYLLVGYINFFSLNCNEIKSKIIIINGSSSAGKSSIIAHMQKMSEKPLLVTGIDHAWMMVPSQYVQYGEKSDEGYRFVTSCDAEGNTIVLIESGCLGEYIDKAKLQIIKSLADSGIDVVVDEVLINESQYKKYIKNFQQCTVYFIGITCVLSELE